MAGIEMVDNVRPQHNYQISSYVIFIYDGIQKGFTVLHYAAYYGHVHLVNLLLDKKADKEATTKVNTSYPNLTSYFTDLG